MAKTTDRMTINGVTYHLKDNYARESIAAEEAARIAGDASVSKKVSKQAITPFLYSGLVLYLNFGTYNQSNHYFESEPIYLEEGLCLTVNELPTGAKAYIRQNGVNNEIEEGAHRFGNEGSVTVRLYTESDSVVAENYFCVNYDSYQYGEPVYGSIPDKMIRRYYIIDQTDNKLRVRYSNTRRCTAPIRVKAGDRISSNGYDISVVSRNSGWISAGENIYTFDSDGSDIIQFRDHSNTSKNISAEDFGGKITLIHDEDRISKHGHPLVTMPLYEKIVYEDTETGGGAQGITSDGEYIYAFSGTGICHKINIETMTATKYNISEIGHGNCAAYNPDNECIYVLPLGDTGSVLRYSKEMELQQTILPVDEDGNRVYAGNIAFNPIEKQFFVIAYHDGDDPKNIVYVYSSSFEYIKTITLNVDMTRYVGQGMETDGMYIYLPTAYGDPTFRIQIVIFDVCGNYIGRRLPMYVDKEIEDITIDPKTGKIYATYQYDTGTVYACRVVEMQSTMEGWDELSKIIDTKSSNATFAVGNANPMFRLEEGKMYLRGLVKVAQNDNVTFRIKNGFSPKKSELKEGSVIGANGIETEENVLRFGNTTAFYNHSIPARLNSTGTVDISCVIHDIDPLYVPHSNIAT